MTETPDQRAIFEYLQFVFEPSLRHKQDAYLVASYLESGTWRSKSFAIGEIDKAANWLALVNEVSNAYYRVNLLGSPLNGGRGKFADNAYVTHFVCDIDYGKDGHSSETLVPTLEDAVQILSETLPPTKILHSGGGVYGVYLLNEPLDVRKYEDNVRARSLGQALENALRQFGEVDSINNGAHVIRPIGSMNHKREKLFQVCEIAGTNETFTLQQLENAFKVEKKLSAEKELLAIETNLNWQPTKVGRIFNEEPSNTWLAILQADQELNWRENGRNVFACEGSSTGKSATIENDRFYIHSDTVAKRFGFQSGGVRLDKFGLAALILGKNPKALNEELLK
jgi:hypothetical protein